MNPDKIRYAALGLLVPVTYLCFAAFQTPVIQQALAHGPIQIGHDTLECNDCHKKPDASWRQQIQANVHYVVGARSEPVDFGYHPVESSTCLDCHDRPNERHPVYRFREPRFQEALEQVDASSCLGCHSEHANERSFADIEFCSACHEDLKLQSDPVDVAHETLIANDDWGTCMGCHDYHGNHIYQTPTILSSAISVDELRAYLSAGPNPYGSRKRYEALNQ